MGGQTAGGQAGGRIESKGDGLHRYNQRKRDHEKATKRQVSDLLNYLIVIANRTTPWTKTRKLKQQQLSQELELELNPQQQQYILQHQQTELETNLELKLQENTTAQHQEQQLS